MIIDAGNEEKPALSWPWPTRLVFVLLAAANVLPLFFWSRIEGWAHSRWSSTPGAEPARPMQVDAIWQAVGLLCKSHPWHGVPIGAEAPARVTVYVEIVPTDTVKYELDKDTRPAQGRPPAELLERLPEPRTASCPRRSAPRRTAAFCEERTGRTRPGGRR